MAHLSRIPYPATQLSTFSPSPHCPHSNTLFRDSRNLSRPFIFVFFHAVRRDCFKVRADAGVLSAGVTSTSFNLGFLCLITLASFCAGIRVTLVLIRGKPERSFVFQFCLTALKITSASEFVLPSHHLRLSSHVQVSHLAAIVNITHQRNLDPIPLEGPNRC